KDHTVVVKYTVANPGNQDLYFSIGAHPGFMCPIGKDDRFDDYTLLFNRYSLLQTVLEDGLRSENRKLLPLEEKTLPLTSALFDNDALVFDNGQVSEVTLRSVRGG